MTIIALHGFLGRPRDWAGVQAHCPENLNWIFIDLFSSPFSSWTLQDWQTHFPIWVEKLNLKPPIFFMGYSLGGRLLLEALPGLEKQSRGIFLISTGFEMAENDRAKRRESDQNWAFRFESQDFDQVVKEWNHQAVFNGSQAEPKRQKYEYPNGCLSWALTEWSLGKQKTHRETIEKSATPILYLVGDHDEKYKRLATSLKKVPFEVIQHSGHRVLFDQPAEVANHLKKFISES